MADRILKVLSRLTQKERDNLIKIIGLIDTNNLAGLDLKKLHGTENTYRVRKGNFRVIFVKTPSGGNSVLAIERRSDTTYK